MTTIEIMLEALKRLVGVMNAMGYETDPNTEYAVKAIALGEAELRREPTAWNDLEASDYCGNSDEFCAGMLQASLILEKKNTRKHTEMTQELCKCLQDENLQEDEIRSYAREAAAELERLTEEKDKCGSGAGCLHKDAQIDNLTEQLNRLGECLRLLLSLHISAHNAVEHATSRKCLYNIFGDLK